MTSALQSVRDRLRLRQRFRDRSEVKGDGELHWWLREWDPILRDGGFSPPDALDLLDGEPVGDTYEARRWQQARAEVPRVLREAAIDDPSFFDGKVVVDIGPGALGFPDACPARISIGVEPLAQRFADAGLLLPDSHAIYLPVRAEAIPLVGGCVDVVVARNSLDHVDDPRATVHEAARILRRGGVLILNFDVDHTPTETEPHALSVSGVRDWVSADFTVTHLRELDHGHGHDGHAVILVATRT